MGAAWTICSAADDEGDFRNDPGQGVMIGSWTFNSTATAANFESHVRGHLAWYDMVTDAVAMAAGHYIPTGGLVYDLGCGNGNVGRALAGILQARDATLIGVDRSAPMCTRYTAPGSVICGEIEAVPMRPFDVAVSMLTLMFLHPIKQEAVINKLAKLAKPGGAIILVEKEIGSGGYFQTIMQRITFAAKIKTGTTPAEVMQKEFSLVGVQRPIKHDIIHNTRLHVAEFFRFGEFAGYIMETHGK